MFTISDLLLLSAASGLVAGFLGGIGGRYAALLNFRRELRAVADQVDPRLAHKLAEQAREMTELSGRVDAATSTAKSIAGKLGQETRKAVIGPEDLAFITAHVEAQLRRTGAVRAVGT